MQQVCYASRERAGTYFLRDYFIQLEHCRTGDTIKSVLEFLKPSVVRVDSFRALKNFYYKVSIVKTTHNAHRLRMRETVSSAFTQGSTSKVFKTSYYVIFYS